MAYTKQYSKTTWVNNQAPAINATNLNKIEEGIDNVDSGLVEVEQSLTVRMDELEDRVEEIEQGGGGLTDGIKQALLQIAQKVAYIDEHGQDYYDDLYDALYAVTAIRISPTSLSFSTLGSTQQLTAMTTPSGATVTWASSNTSVATVDANGLVTSVGYGSATITATAGSITATCSVVVAQATVTSIDAVYTQSGTVYDTDSLDSLKDDLVVTAHWSNGTTSTVASADYTLSGTLTEGTSTITASYGGKTATFNVTVTHDGGLYPLENGTHTFTTNNRTLTVTNGYHFEYTAPNATSSGTPAGAYLNLSEVSENDDSATAASNINKTTTLFTLPSGASVVFEVKNISFTNLGTAGSNNKYAVALRNNTTSVITSGDKTITDTDDITVTQTISSDTPITCVFAYLRNQFSSFQADISLTVNGERWI